MLHILDVRILRLRAIAFPALLIAFAVSPGSDVSAANHVDEECTAARQRAVEYGRTVRNMPGGRELASKAMEEALAFCRQRRTDRTNNARETLAASCEQLRAWLTTRPVPTGRSGSSSRASDPDLAVMTLIEDGRFSAAFGKKYDELTQEELRALTQKTLPQCFSSQGALANLGANEKSAASRALNALSFQNNVRGLTQARASADQLAALGREADSLQATEPGYARLIAMWLDAHPLLPRVTPERREVYQKHYAAAERRVALKVEAATVERTSKEARGYDGLIKVIQVSDSLARASLADEVRVARDEHRKKLAARANEIGQTVGAAERVKIDAIGSGMSGLESGVRWKREFDARYATLASKVDSIRSIATYFDERRRITVGATQKEFREHLQWIDSEAEIQKFVDRYITSSELNAPSGAAMLTAVAAQRYELQKRSVIGRPPERNLSAPSSREPTIGEMYDAVSFKLMGFAQELSKIEKNCMAGGISRDAASAFTCLYMINAANHGGKSPSKISRFEKIGCAQAVGRPGYMCDYILGIEGGMMGAMGSVIEQTTAQGTNTTSRFVYSPEHGWMHISRLEDR